ncbi:uncharacterized protein LOC135334946 [Halichondria panicea]|uniref:uncharacterized protein LOC135334946 n=1 Tax=Halichondria panicea TaxID=6063 RepID=UPI00312BA0CE
MERFLCILVALCALCTVSYSMQDDTLLDDEDTEQQRGMFTLELDSELGCIDWQSYHQDVPVKSSILEGLIAAVNNSCRCDFTRHHIVHDAINCDQHARNVFLLNGEISFMANSETSHMPDLLRGVEEWAGSRPVFPFVFSPGEVVMPTTITLTMTKATTGLINSGDGASGSGSGSGYADIDAMVTVTQATTSEAPTTTTTTTMITTMETTSDDVTSKQVNATDQILLPIAINSCYPVTVSLVTVILLIVCSAFFTF